MALGWCYWGAIRFAVRSSDVRDATRNGFSEALTPQPRTDRQQHSLWDVNWIPVVYDHYFFCSAVRAGSVIVII